MQRFPQQQSFLRNFFFELAKDSELLRPDNQLDREMWFRKLDLYRKEEMLFELEMYLRAIGCFFNLHNQFLTGRDQAITADFTEELKVLRAALERASLLAQLLLDRGVAGTMNFQSYIENQVVPDYLRLKLMRRILDQKRPEESLFILSRCLRDLKRVLDHLMKREQSPYSLFFHFGQIVTREIAQNRFFNPLLIFEFRPEYDRIRSVEILDCLKTIDLLQERRMAGRIFLALYRLLHYLRYIPGRGAPAVLRRSLILFTLFHSEATTLSGFLKVLAGKAQLSPGLVKVAGLVADEMQGELRRMFGETLVTVDVKRSKLFGDQERSVKASREILEQFLKECLVRFMRVYQEGVDAGRLFDQAHGQREQAKRLRADLWIFRQLLERVSEEQGLASQGQIPPYLPAFLGSFLDSTYNLLRYGDSAPFENYHDILVNALEYGLPSERKVRSFLEATAAFHDRLVEIYDFVCRRSELRATPLPEEALAVQLEGWLRTPAVSP